MLPKWGTWACLHGDGELADSRTGPVNSHNTAFAVLLGNKILLQIVITLLVSEEFEMYLLPILRFLSVVWAQLAQLDLSLLSEGHLLRDVLCELPSENSRVSTVTYSSLSLKQLRKRWFPDLQFPNSNNSPPHLCNLNQPSTACVLSKMIFISKGMCQITALV